MKHNIDESDYISPKWDAPSHWDEIYIQDQKEGKSTINRDPQYLLKSIEKLNRPAPLKILDAGTGISTLPEFSAYLGHHVVAIDFSDKAIEICRSRKVTDNDLMNCLSETYDRGYKDGKFIYFDRSTANPVDLRSELRNLSHPGGNVIAHEVFDWNDPQLSVIYGPFDIVLNQNGLRCASYESIRKAFASFHQLLKPGGIAIETNINALIREKTFMKYALEAGFTLLNTMWILYDYPQYKTPLNNNEKYMLMIWPTG